MPPRDTPLRIDADVAELVAFGVVFLLVGLWQVVKVRRELRSRGRGEGPRRRRILGRALGAGLALLLAFANLASLGSEVVVFEIGSKTVESQEIGERYEFVDPLGWTYEVSQATYVRHQIGEAVRCRHHVMWLTGLSMSQCSPE